MLSWSRDQAVHPVFWFLFFAASLFLFFKEFVGSGRITLLVNDPGTPVASFFFDRLTFPRPMIGSVFESLCQKAE